MDLSVLERRPWHVLAVYALVVGGLYALGTRIQWQAPLVVAATSFDRFVPLVPPAAYVYVTYTFAFPLLIVLARHRAGFGKVLAAGLACGLANVIVFNALPSRIAERLAAPPGTLLEIIQQLDTPFCAIPSGHVALPAAIAAAALMVARSAEGPARFWRAVAVLFAAWTAVLGAAALLTKQHYVTDIAAGLVFGPAVGLLTVWLLPRAVLHRPTALALLLEWVTIIITLAVAVAWPTAPVLIAAGLVIASRQHALLALFHDGVHGLAARSGRVNDFVINMLVGVPLLLPLHLYRALHHSHHRHLGEDCDPERVLLYHGQRWNFRPLPGRSLALQLAGDVAVWNGVGALIRYFRETARGTALKLSPTRAYPELAWQFAAWYGALAAAFVAWPRTTLLVTLLWFVTYVTLTQLLQKIRSFAEHAPAERDPSLACSWSTGLLGRLTIWPYNINYHREHHAHAEVPWNRLPAAFPSARQRPGHQLIFHLWNGQAR